MKKIAELEAKIDEMDNRYFRLQADFDNFTPSCQVRHGSGSKI